MLLNFRTFFTAPDFSLKYEIFLLNDIFLYKLKNCLEAYFIWHISYISTDLLNKQKRPFADVLKIGILKKFAIITEKHLCWSLFLIKLQTWRPAALLNRDSSTGISMWILQKFLRTALFIKHLRWLLLNKLKTNVKSTFILLSLLWNWIQNVL